MNYNFQAMNKAIEMFFAAVEKPKIPECQHRNDPGEDRDHWKFMSSRRIASHLFRVTYQCESCGCWATRIEESPDAP